MIALVISAATRPPVDGQRFIAEGAIVEEDDLGCVSEPFVGRVYVEDGELRWAISGTYRQCVRCHPDSTVYIHAWAPLPQFGIKRIQEVA